LAAVAGLGAAVALVVAYRRQRELKRDEAGQRDQTRLLTERFGAAATQLGGEQAAVRLAGVYAMAAVADEWEAQRQAPLRRGPATRASGLGRRGTDHRVRQPPAAAHRNHAVQAG
jgi:hypothetical protein